MLNIVVGASIFSVVLLTGWTPSAHEVPAPVPQPGPGPTVPPKPSDPAPPSPKPLTFTLEATDMVLLYLSANAPSEEETASGTLSKLNLTEKEGRLTTDLGRDVIFHIAKSELFVHLSVGQRVTIKLDAGQRAVGVMETTTPELHPPPPAR